MSRKQMDTELADVFAANLVQQLKKKDMSRYQLAKDVGVSESTVYEYVNKKSLPSLQTFSKIVEVLEVEADILLNV